MYSFGWSHGKEKLEGKPDTAKGSFYFNPIHDRPVSNSLPTSHHRQVSTHACGRESNGTYATSRVGFYPSTAVVFLSPHCCSSTTRRASRPFPPSPTRISGQRMRTAPASRLQPRAAPALSWTSASFLLGTATPTSEAWTLHTRSTCSRRWVPVRFISHQQ